MLYEPARTYAIGEPVASSEFPSLRESQVVVGGLVLSLWTSTHGTLALPKEALHLDGASGLDSGCQLALAADEAVRCLPGKASTVQYFSDEVCTSPVLISEGATSPRPTGSVLDQEGRTHVYVAGDVVDGDVYGISGAGECKHISPPRGTAQVRLEELAPARFPRYELVQLAE